MTAGIDEDDDDVPEIKTKRESVDCTRVSLTTTVGKSPSFFCVAALCSLSLSQRSHPRTKLNYLNHNQRADTNRITDAAHTKP